MSDHSKILTQAEKLERLILFAVDNGWSWIDFFSTSTHGVLRYKGLVDEVVEQMLNVNTWPVLLFNKKFAEHLWGDWPQLMKDVVPKGIKAVTDIPQWQYRLQQMVIADDPIEYAYSSVFGV